MNIIYITGLSRSGTTYLSKELVNSLNALSIGESIKNIEIWQDEKELKRYQEENRKCTCGKHPTECPFWRDILCESEAKDKKEVFDLILRKVRDEYEGAIVIDTSKSVSRLKEFYSESVIKKYGINLVVVNIIRHCCGQIESYQSYHKKWNRTGVKASILADAVYWAYKNYKNLKFLRDNKKPTLTIIYEDLVFEKRRTLEIISQFVDRNMKDCQKTIPTMHEMGGNEGFKKQSNFNVKYNAAWMFNPKLTRYSILLSPFMCLNSFWHKKYGIEKRNKHDTK